MTDTPTNRELHINIKFIREAVGRIEKQVKKTNCRVSRLERWRSYTLGGGATLTLLFVPVLLCIIMRLF